MQHSDLIVKFNADGRTAILHEPLIMSWMDSSDYRVTKLVPPAFETDFASIPQAVRSVLSQLGRWTAPAVMHDWLYYTGLLGSQKAADDAFNEMMKEAGVVTWRRLAIYSALRLGGWVAYKNHRSQGHSIEEWFKKHGIQK